MGHHASLQKVSEWLYSSCCLNTYKSNYTALSQIRIIVNEIDGFEAEHGGMVIIVSASNTICSAMIMVGKITVLVVGHNLVVSTTKPAGMKRMVF